MNAIQFFDWGKSSALIVKWRIKNFFLTQQAQTIFDYMKQFSGKIGRLKIRIAGSHNTNFINVETINVIRQENDMIVTIFNNRYPEEFKSLLNFAITSATYEFINYNYSIPPKTLINIDILFKNRKIYVDNKYFNSGTLTMYGNSLYFEDTKETLKVSDIVGQEFLIVPKNI